VSFVCSCIFSLCLVELLIRKENHMNLEQACIIMKFYEGSLGDKLAHLPGNKLPLADVLR
jgi:hypothetical protein